MEEVPVSLLCVTRKLQEKPYEPLHPQEVQQAIGQQMSLRPPPYVAQDQLFEFYAILSGHCNTKPMDNATPFVADLLTMAPGPAAAPSHSASVGVLPAPPSDLASVQDFRLQQIRHNERHVGSKGSRLCSYFNTREGCRRGASCPYAHVMTTAQTAAVKHAAALFYPPQHQ